VGRLPVLHRSGRTSAAVLTLGLGSLSPALGAGTEGDLLEEAKDFFGREEGVLWEEGLTLVFI